MRIVHAASEFAPWVRVGHLAGVVGGLSRELARLGHEVAVFLPGYRQVLADPRAVHAQSVFKHTLELGDQMVTAETLRLELASNLTLYLVRRDESFDRTFPYGPPGGDYEDRDTRFLIFCKAVVDALCRSPAPADVLHCHDWPTALTPLLLRLEERKRHATAALRTALTIHNPMFQGVFPRRTFGLTNLPEEFFTPEDGLEFFGQVNFLKGGMIFADALLAPSPAAAREALTPAGGFGLDGVLGRRRDDFHGLLTGLDDAEWNPFYDKYLAAPFDARAPAGKGPCRGALRWSLGLGPATVGHALVAAALPSLTTHALGHPRELVPALADDMALILLGPAVPAELAAWRELAEDNPGRVFLFEDPDEATVHRVLGGADFFLGASCVEPSPHHAQRALRYGALPILPRTGGAADVVVDLDDDPAHGNGVLFAPDAAGWRDGLARARALHLARAPAEAARARGLGLDSTWARHAQAFTRLYQEII